MSQRNVTISFKSHMFDTDEQIEITAKGIHGIKNGKHYVTYNEEDEGNKTVRNILKFDSESLEVSKIGTTRTNMYYKAEHTHTDVYRTPFGEYDMCIKTEEYALFETEKNDMPKYDIVLLYNLELGGSHVSTCKVEISVEG